MDDMVTYDRYIRNLAGRMKKQDWWSFIADKNKGKELVESLGVPAPRTFELPFDAVIKPKRSHSAKNIFIFDEHEKWVAEELLRDEDGGELIRDFRWYFFGDQARMVHVSRVGTDPKTSGYYTWPDWKGVEIDSKRPWLECEAPTCVKEMHDYAQRIARQFPVPIRVDMYATTRGPVFGELCVSPGLVVGKRLTEAGNDMLSGWLAEYLNDQS